MIGLLRAWGGALFILIVGMMTMVRLTPRIAPGEPISVTDQAFRIHLPWIVLTTLMVVVAAILHRVPSTPRRLLTTLPVPALGILIGTVAGVARATSAVTTLLYAGEGVLGVACGLFVAKVFAGDDEPASHPYPG